MYSNTSRIISWLKHNYGAATFLNIDYLHSPFYIRINIIRTEIPVSYLPFKFIYNGELCKINM